MKKLIIITTLLGLVWISPAYSQEVSGIPAAISTPSELVSWFSYEFKYQMKIPDRPQSPQETIDLKTGDCDDFAVLASVALNRIGVPNDILIIEFDGLDIKHAVCMWKNSDLTFSYLSNKKIYSTGMDSIKDAISKYYPDWSRVVFADDERNHIKVLKR